MVLCAGFLCAELLCTKILCYALSDLRWTSVVQMHYILDKYDVMKYFPACRVVFGVVLFLVCIPHEVVFIVPSPVLVLTVRTKILWAPSPNNSLGTARMGTCGRSDGYPSLLSLSKNTEFFFSFSSVAVGWVTWHPSELSPNQLVWDYVHKIFVPLFCGPLPIKGETL